MHLLGSWMRRALGGGRARAIAQHVSAFRARPREPAHGESLEAISAKERHISGNGVIIQITVGSTVSSVFQGAGTHAQYSLGTTGVSTRRRLDITNASGDSFHVGCRWGV
ncbi:hypothetical protein [Corallococcus macrosporus]|uniref:hypothetical protein n=1 Tax=Corallococcus macrosporus TaxID=35 RepID=UPI000F4F8A62|nr:hypothetical protein [Corallococcus macrosporus]